MSEKNYGLRFLYTSALFLGAFLLFCSQPMVGKMMLPLLGGAASVWTTAVLFFQVALLAGYFYADRLARLKSVRGQAVVHLLLMAAAFLFLPMSFTKEGLGAAGFQSPVLWELLRLTQTVGVPYLMISTTAPLLQSWFSRSHDESAGDPYFLYAASNAGSLLGLLAYPFVIEPRLGVRDQSVWWTAGYASLLIFVLIAVFALRRTKAVPVVAADGPSPALRTCLYWMAAAFVPSGLFLAVTTHISVNLTVPLVWTIPLAVYLITFILAFGRRLRVSSAGIARAVPPLLVLLCPVVGLRVPVGFDVDVFLIAIHMVVLFLGALLCHTALADARPAATHLTRYYLWISVGGALGGIFAALLAPMLFNTILEYPLLLGAAMFFRKPASGRRWLPAIGLAALVLGYAAFLPGYLAEPGTPIYVTRNFFGIKKVMDVEPEHVRKLLNGDTMHGLESREPDKAGRPSSYFHPDGPLGDVMKMLKGAVPQRVGVVGLGAGSIAGYGSPERHITFFEIDPQVEAIAKRFFTFLERCGNNCDVTIGDGRLSIARSPDQSYDLIVIDAFSSDAIPAHLLSREAMAIYKSKIKPDGAILFHVSNRYLKVKELVSAVAADAKLTAFLRVDDGEIKPLKSRSVYVVIAPKAPNPLWQPAVPPPGLRSWTDDYSNLLELVNW